nr:adenine phosphoribosyltransferase [Micrococcus luteus]
MPGDADHTRCPGGVRPRVEAVSVTSEIARARSLIRVVPDHPSPGVAFQDITPLLADARALRACVEALVAPFEGRFDLVAGLEARGFLLAGAAAVLTGTGLVPLRKAGRLPAPAARADYTLEYGTASIEVSEDLRAGSRVLLLDDVLATGGTLAAGRRLIEARGAEVVGAACLLELTALGGRAVVPDTHVLFAA